MKQVIDKCYCRGMQLKNKKTGVIIVGGAPTDNEEYKLIGRQYDMLYYHFELTFSETISCFSHRCIF